MKKKVLIGVVAVIIAIGVIGSLGGDKKEKKEEVKTQETAVAEKVKEEVKFEDISYYKNNNDRHFQIYTQNKDKNILIEEARKKAWTEGKITVVSFWTTKDDKEVPYLALAKDEDTGIFMQGISNLNPEKLTGVFFKDVFGKETWYEGNIFLKDSVTAEEIEKLN